MSDATYSTIDAVVLAKTDQFVILRTEDGTEYSAHSDDCEDFDGIVVGPQDDPIEVSLTDEWLENNGFEAADDGDDDE